MAALLAALVFAKRARPLLAVRLAFHWQRVRHEETVLAGHSGAAWRPDAARPGAHRPRVGAPPGAHGP